MEATRKGEPKKREEKKKDSPGNNPFIPNATTKTVINILSAIGSITVPTTVCNFHLLAIHPSSASLTPA